MEMRDECDESVCEMSEMNVCEMSVSGDER